MAGLASAGVLTALPAASAQAASAATACPPTTLVQPFTQWADAGYYSLVPGGNFERAEVGWTLSGGATIAAGGEPYVLAGTRSTSSLELPEGASAQSPVICVEPNDRTFRFFTRSEGSSATLAVQPVYQTIAGPLVLLGKGVTADRTWEPSAILHTGAAVLSAISHGVAYLSLRFTAKKGTARIDDVYLDPRMR